MPIDPITSFDRHSHIREAARNRVLSSISNELDETDIEKLVDSYLHRQFPAKETRLLSEGVFAPGDVLLSQESREELRDKNFLVEATARTINDLRAKIARSGLAYERQLTSLQRTMQDIGTEVFAEHAVTVNYDLSAGNGFHANFGGSNFFDFTYTDLQDPRTKRKFLGNEYVTTDLFPAVIMPVAEYEPASIKDIEIDYAMSGLPAFEGYFETTDPMLMIEPGKVFHARYYLPFDVGPVPLFFAVPMLTVVFRFSSLTSINCMSISAFTKDTMYPAVIEAMIDGKWERIDAFPMGSDEMLTEVLAFEDTLTDAVRVIFSSYGFDSYTVLDRSNTENTQLNQLLRESQWKTLFKEESLEFTGRQVDWYIKDVEFAQIRTLERGYAVSSPLPFKGHLKKLLTVVSGLKIQGTGRGNGNTAQVSSDVFTWQQMPTMTGSSFVDDGRTWIAGDDNTDVGRAVWYSEAISGQLYFEMEYNATNGPGGSSVNGAKVALGLTNSDQGGQSYDVDMTDFSWGGGIRADTGNWRTNGSEVPIVGSSALNAGDRLAFAVNRDNGQTWIGLVGPGPAYTVTWWGAGSPNPGTFTDPTIGMPGVGFRPAASDADAAAMAKITVHGKSTGLSTPPPGWTWWSDAKVPGGGGDSQDLSGLGIEVYLEVKASNSEGKVVVEELLPCPSLTFGNTQQNELQVFIGNVSMLRFFPQINLAETTLQENTVSDHSQILPVVQSSIRGELQIGTDYQVTVDGGSTWLNAWPSSDYYGKVTYAGLAGIRVLGLQEGEQVVVSYYPAQRQWLSKTKNFYLRGSRIFASKALRQQNLSGTVRAVVILRKHPAGINGLETLFYGVKYVSEQQSET